MIVGLNGRSDVNKTAGALALAGIGYAQFSFTAPLREMLVEVNPRLVSYGSSSMPIYRSLAPLVTDKGWEHALSHPSYRSEMRRLLNSLGNGMRRTCGDDVLINALVSRIQNQMGGLDVEADIVISDVRLPDEARWIREHGGIVIEVRHPSPRDLCDDPTEQPLPPGLINDSIIRPDDDSQFADELIELIAKHTTTETATLTVLA